MAKQDTELVVIQRLMRELSKLSPEAADRVVEYISRRRGEIVSQAKSTVAEDRNMELFGNSDK